MAHQKKRDADYIVKGNGEILSKMIENSGLPYSRKGTRQSVGKRQQHGLDRTLKVYSIQILANEMQKRYKYSL